MSLESAVSLILETAQKIETQEQEDSAPPQGSVDDAKVVTKRGLKINYSEFPTSIKHISLGSRVEVIFLYDYLKKGHYRDHSGIVRGIELKDVGIVRKIYAPSLGIYLVYVELENEVASQDLRIIWGRRPKNSKMPFPEGTSENLLVVRPQHLRPLL